MTRKPLVGLALLGPACGGSETPAGHRAGSTTGADAGGAAGAAAGGAAGAKAPTIPDEAGAPDAGGGACAEGLELSAECETCLTASCCEAAATCAATEQCVPLFNCLRPCPVNDAGCLMACFDEYPSGSAQGASAGIDGCFMQHCPSCKLW